MPHELMQELHKDHQEVQGMFKKLLKEKDSGKRSSMFDELRKEIIPHMDSEERHVYRALMDGDGAREDAMEAIEEHRAARSLIKELDKLDAGDEWFHPKAKVLMEMVEHHITEEESQIFKDLEKLGTKRLDDLLEGFQKTKEQKKRQLS
jgi:hemerythrin superfamily protein